MGDKETIYQIKSTLQLFYSVRWYNFKEVIKMKPLKEKIGITIDGDILEKVKQAAEEDDRSVSQFINLVLKKYFADK